MPSDLASKFRPSKLEQIVGQPIACSTIRGWALAEAIPHAVFLVGPSGTGKTTLARILAQLVGARPHDIREIDSAEDRGIDMARNLIEEMGAWSKPLPPSKVKVAIVDEAVQLPETTQQALLTLLEEPEPWTYFFFCASNTRKLLNSFKSRFKTLKLNELRPEHILTALNAALDQLQVTVADQLLGMIAQKAEGNLRTAFGLLERILALPSESLCRQALREEEGTDDAPADVRNLCRVLLKAGRGDATLVDVLSRLDQLSGSPETVRLRVLLYMNKVLRAGNSKAAAVIRVFQYDFSQYLTAASAGLALYCHDAYFALRNSGSKG